MLDQTPLNGTKAPVAETAARAVARNTGEFLHDLVTLAELQLRLLFIDGQQELRHLLWPTLIMMAGLAVGLAALPVLLIALALTLMEVARFSPAQAAGIASAFGFAVAGLLVGCGWLGLRVQNSEAFERSARECRQNLRWIKDSLQQSGSHRSCAHNGTSAQHRNN